MSIGASTFVSFLSTGALVVLALIVPSLRWQSTAGLHTIIEAVAAGTAGYVGVIALIRFFSDRRADILFIGAGFFGTGLLDAYHAVVTSELFAATFPSSPAPMIAWSWLASRVFLAACMLLSWVVARTPRLRRPSRPMLIGVLSTAGVLTGVSFLIFTTVELPPAYYPELLISRPQELIPGLLFAVALVGYLSDRLYRPSVTMRWVVASLVVNVVLEMLIMSRSRVLFDAAFDIAHVLKIVSYLLVFGGLVASIRGLYRAAISHNQKLAAEIETRERAERRLAVSERRYRDLYDQAPDMYLTVEMPSGTIMDCNEQVVRSLGLSKRQLIGTNIVDAYHPNQASGARRSLETFLETGQLSGQEMLVKTADGSYVPVSVRATIAIDEHGVTFSRTMWRDITPRKKIETALAEKAKALARSNAELQQFAYIASHDLQEPLRMVTSYLQLIARRYEELLDEPGREFIHFAVDGAERMKGLIQDLLAYSRVGTAEVHFEPVDCRAVVASVLMDLRLAIQEAGATIDVGELPTLQGDEGQLRQLFANLIANALKFRAERALRVSVRAKRARQGWQFEVQDNGMGFDPALADRVFLMFKRLHGRDARPGTGIGLAICKKVVDRHGGTIWADAVQGEGATFTFVLSGRTHEGGNREPPRPGSSEEDGLGTGERDRQSELPREGAPGDVPGGAQRNAQAGPQTTTMNTAW